ncbi:hypothetical protein ABE222_06470 [Bacillus tropicus]|uniref:hypothetical protein n=1 Tax=Bacillus tropicus TaxID=2026188 RepID=UPI003D1B388B
MAQKYFIHCNVSRYCGYLTACIRLTNTDREGKYAPLQQELQTVLTRVYEQVEERNLIHNGDFKNRVTDWTVIGDVNPNTEGLLFTDQYTNTPQTIQLENWKEDTEYTLSVSRKGNRYASTCRRQFRNNDSYL